MPDTELIALTAATVIGPDDVLYAVVDPDGTPADRKTTGLVLAKSVHGMNKVTARPTDGASNAVSVFASLDTPWTADITLDGTADVRYEVRATFRVSGNTYGFAGLYRDGTLIDQGCSTPVNSGQRHEIVLIGEDEGLTADTYTYEVKFRAGGDTVTVANTAGLNNTPYNTRAGISFMRLQEV